MLFSLWHIRPHCSFRTVNTPGPDEPANTQSVYDRKQRLDNIAKETKLYSVLKTNVSTERKGDI